MLSLAMIGMVAGSANAETNRTYDYLSSNMRPITTEIRPKANDSSVYVNHLGETQVTVQVWSGDGNFTQGGSVVIGIHQQAWIKNYVKETKHNDCYLKIAPADYGTFRLYGQWRPDSN